MEASEPRVPPAEAWWKDSLLVAFHFRCNVACRFCMVEDALGALPGTSLAEFEQAARDPARMRGVRRIIFSGGEVTLSKELAEYVRLARSLPGVEHVRVQTNATRLGTGTLLEQLLAAGVDEFFVSLHAADRETCDALLQKEGSFDAILAGMRAIADARAALFTNTAIVDANHAQLRAIVELAAKFAPRSMEFWSYWPRADEDGARKMTVRVADVRPHLFEALGACVARGIPPVVKWFPRCLMGPYAAYHDDGQPPSLIDDAYWSREPEYACLYEGVCADAGKGCAGLSHTYIEAFGWEEALLAPRREAARSDANAGTNADSVLTRSLVKDGAHRTTNARIASWLASFDLAVDCAIAGFVVLRAKSERANELAITFAKGNRFIEAVVMRRDEARACLARTKSFDLVYTSKPGVDPDEAATLTRALALRIASRDDGGGALPA